MKTSELTGPALDWAVAKCEDGATNPLAFTGANRSKVSESWATCGPIIEREHISVRHSDGQWVAEWWPDNSGMAKKPSQRFVHNRQMVGPTALIAAMRCYVASKLGDDVNIPSELEAA